MQSSISISFEVRTTIFCGGLVGQYLCMQDTSTSCEIPNSSLYDGMTFQLCGTTSYFNASVAHVTEEFVDDLSLEISRKNKIHLNAKFLHPELMKIMPM